MRTFWNYYGGKWRVAPRYPHPCHDVVIEPFAGAAGYSLRHHRKNVILIDADEIIAGVWSYLIGASPDEIMALPDSVESVDDLRVPQEARWLIGFCLNSATASPCKTASKWMRQTKARNPESANFWGPARKRRIASQVNEIKHWRIIHGSYTDAPNVPATWFVDPPYQVAGRHYRHGSDGIDYGHLGSWCRERDGLVIACENEGASWLPFRPFGAIKASSNNRNGGVSSEVVWINNHRLAQGGELWKRQQGASVGSPLVSGSESAIGRS